MTCTNHLDHERRSSSWKCQEKISLSGTHLLSLTWQHDRQASHWTVHALILFSMNMWTSASHYRNKFPWTWKTHFPGYDRQHLREHGSYTSSAWQTHSCSTWQIYIIYSRTTTDTQLFKLESTHLLEHHSSPLHSGTHLLQTWQPHFPEHDSHTSSWTWWTHISLNLDRDGNRVDTVSGILPHNQINC